MTLALDGSSGKKIRKTALCFMGLSHLIHLKEYLKGVIFALIEVGFIACIPFIAGKIRDLITLGSPHPELAARYRDNSTYMLIDGILVLALIGIFAALYVISVRSAEKSYGVYCRTGRYASQKISESLNNAFPIAGLAPCVVMLLVFVVVPLVFSIAVAFTNYSSPYHLTPAKTIDWVGADNFISLIFGGTGWSAGFARVAIWTIIWAVLSTFTCYFGGLIVAISLQESGIRFSSVFRFIFILPYAVPSVITMLVWKNMLNGTFGTINRTLWALGIVKHGTVIPWLGDATIAQIMCIVVNLWAGFGYFMMLSMGTMTAIPKDLYEAARMDGANSNQVMRHVTLPLVLFQTMPLIIMSFTHNINNFGIIYFLTGGDPTVADTTTTRAGGTDILVTWIYKLTMNLMRYDFASVIAVLIFVVLAPFAIYQFKNTKAYKEGEL
ncbi:carbohydrate ABC transporter permease [Treponema sp.]|uniref:carbohydrate ABC transporter permease n=1 Tax=Treponema sp. TaxID=166 RepID=UPI0025D84DB8|nr:sugar ABC transporter permease [Treponema sp.]MCR5217850.1 sugar ABC transporter permease [Treponema sp.]